VTGNQVSIADFDLVRLYEALDQQRRARGLTWAAARLQMNGSSRGGPSISTSAITGLTTRRSAEGDGVLQMIQWLGRTPESFVADHPDADDPRFRFPALTADYILRWDTQSLYAALDAARRERHLTWAATATEIGGFTPAMLQHLQSGGRVALPGVMRIVQWLGRPAITFTRRMPRAARRQGGS